MIVTYTARPHVVHEANWRQLKDLNPNVAVLPWGATEAHNWHLPHGTDIMEADALGELAVRQANERGARSIVLPCVPFGINHTQIYQSATITMRAATQLAVLRDVAESLHRQGIDRLVLLNFHGGNDFKSMVRDVMLDVPIFIVCVNGYQLAPEHRDWLDDPSGDHAEEMETSLILHVAPHLVAPLDTAHDGSTTPSELPALTGTPGVWAVRDWKSLTESSGVGDPKAATAAKGERILQAFADRLTDVLVELSQAKNGQFPFVLPE
jgi:creatinine amidohydrolase